jgi:HEPN domain-containing protein
MIHKNIYSQRLNGSNEIEPYSYDISSPHAQASFVMFFTQYTRDNDETLLQSLVDFCHTRQVYLSGDIKDYMLKDYSYHHGNMADDISTLIETYAANKELGMSALLDFIEICINNFKSNIKESVWRNPYSFNNELLIDPALELQKFEEGINDVFQHNILGFEILNHEIATKESDFLHQEAVVKPLTLLVNEGFEGALREFELAISSYTKKDYETTVLEACKAYESTMKSLLNKLGYTENYQTATASRLLSYLKELKLFEPFMDNMFSSINNILGSSVVTIRNKISGHGDGIDVNEVTRSYASFALNNAGACIVFLIDRYYEAKN